MDSAISNKQHIHTNNFYKKTLLLATLLSFLLICYLMFRITSYENHQQATTKSCIPTFADGGGPYYKENSPLRRKIVPENNTGEKLVVKGKVLQKDCNTPVADAVIDIWQANENGNYQDEWYRGKVTTDKKGNYSFETVVPKGYGEGTAFRPPHIHFKIFLNNVEIITSQMFFPDVTGKEGFNDAYIMDVEKRSEWGSTVFYASHNIILP